MYTANEADNIRSTCGGKRVIYPTLLVPLHLASVCEGPGDVTGNGVSLHYHMRAPPGLGFAVTETRHCARLYITKNSPRPTFTSGASIQREESINYVIKMKFFFLPHPVFYLGNVTCNTVWCRKHVVPPPVWWIENLVLIIPWLRGKLGINFLRIPS